MFYVKRILALVLLMLAVLLFVVGCGRDRVEEPMPPPVTSEPGTTPEVEVTETLVAPASETVLPSETPTTAAQPISEQDLEDALQLVNDFLARLAEGGFREAYGSYLTTGGQQRLAELVLGRLALSNPHISYFELLGAEPIDDRIAVDVTWQEFYDGQGPVGSQEARLLLARQDGDFLVDDAELAEYQPAATPVPPPMPQAEALTNPALPGESMSFRATGFEAGETVLSWLESPDGELSALGFQQANQGIVEQSYADEVTAGLGAGRWIWWAQALRDSTRNTGITFQVLAAPTPTVTPTAAPTPTPRPQPTAAATPAPTATPEPSASYGAPILLWPELETSRDYDSALIVEFVPVADQLGPDEVYELVLVARDQVGNVYGGASARGTGGSCSGVYDQPCRSLTLLEKDMRPLHPEGIEGRGTWYVQVVKLEADGATPISPPSESRAVILKPRN